MFTYFLLLTPLPNLPGRGKSFIVGFKGNTNRNLLKKNIMKKSEVKKVVMLLGVTVAFVTLKKRSLKPGQKLS